MAIESTGKFLSNHYIFTRTGTTWSEVSKLVPADGSADDRFGNAISISGNRAVIGAFFDEDDGSGSGSAYVYVKSGSMWIEETKLTASDAAPFDTFGAAVAMSGNTIIMGAPGGDDPSLNSGSAYVFKRTGTSWTETTKLTASDVATSCIIRTSYDAGGCSGTFQAFSLTDLDDYVVSNFGKNGGTNFQDLKIMDDLTDTSLDIESPCKITLANHVVLDADIVGLDGRKGVIDDNGYTINADTACVLSEQDNAHLGAGSVVHADNLTVQGAKTAKIGRNSMVNMTNVLTVTSTGNFSSSDAIIISGATVDAGAIALSASRGAHLGENTTIAADTIALLSTGETTGSDAGLKAGAEVTADDLKISASREAKVGQNTVVTFTGDLMVDSTGSATGSLAIVKSGADVTVGGTMDLTSGNKATIGQNTTVDVTGNLKMDAASLNKCTVTSSATVAFGSKSGTCAPVLP